MDWVAALLVVLRGKLFQHINGLLIAARTVEQRSEFLDPAVLEKPDGFGAHGIALGWAWAVASRLAEPVLAMLERIGGQVELARRPLPQSSRSRAGGRRRTRWQGLR